MTQFKFSPNNKMVLRAAIAAALGAASLGAQATVNISAATVVPNIVASEIPSTVVTIANPGNLLDLTVNAQVGVQPTAADPYYVRVNLSGAAVFKTAAPTMQCSGITGAGGQTAMFTGVILAGGLGFSYVTYSFSTANTAGAATNTAAYLTGVCTLTLNAAGVSGVTGGVATVVTARTEYKDGASYVTAFVSDKSYITYAKGMTGVVSAASGVVVDATSGSDNFASANSDLTSQTLARLGKYVASAATTSAATATLAGNVSVNDIFSGISITVSGAPLAAALAANGTSGIFLDTATNTCTTKSYTVQSTANAGTTVTFTSIATADIGAATGIQVCMNVSGGTTQIGTGAVYVGTAGTFAANVTASLGGMKQLVSVTTNGTTKNAYIVHSPSSTAKQSQLWMKNTGASAGAVYATCYNAAGTVVGTASSTLVSSLGVNELVYKTSSDVFTAIGYTTGYTATEKFSCVLTAALSGMEFVNQTKDVGTGVINITQAQTN